MRLLVLLAIAAVACAKYAKDAPALPEVAGPEPVLDGTDNDPSCCGWAKIGECDKNPFWMRPNCQVSCGTTGCKVANANECVVKLNTAVCADVVPQPAPAAKPQPKAPQPAPAAPEPAPAAPEPAPAVPEPVSVPKSTPEPAAIIQIIVQPAPSLPAPEPVAALKPVTTAAPPPPPPEPSTEALVPAPVQPIPTDSYSAPEPAPAPAVPEPVAPEPVAPEPVAPEPVAPEPVAPEPTAVIPAETPAPAVKDGEDCDPSCCGWALLGECDKNPFWMRPNCQLSCGTAGCSVGNAHECKVTLNTAACETAPPAKEKPTEPPVLPEPSPAPSGVTAPKVDGAGAGPEPADCSNSDDYCEFWASIGECEKNPTFMGPSCCKACKAVAR